MATTGIQTKVLKDGKKSHAVWYKDPATGKQHHYKSYRLKKIAEQEEQKLRILLDTGEFQREKLKKRKTAVKFEDVTREVEDSWNRKLDTKELSKTTVQNYKVHLKLLDHEFLGQFLGGITAEDILKYQARIAKEVSNATSNRRLFVLKQIFSFAEQKGLISRDVTLHVRYLSEKEHERTNSLKPCELANLLEYAVKARSRHYMPLAILLAAEHGAAKQEILSLKWEDIDFEFNGIGWIHFFRSKNEQKRLHPLKMQRTRDALLERRLYLAKCRKIKEGDVDGFVIGRPNGEAIADIKTAWKAIRQAAGLGDFHFHDLRHTFCTNLLRSGASLKIVKEYIGHKTLRMTDRYTHLESFQELAGFEQLNSLYDS